MAASENQHLSDKFTEESYFLIFLNPFKYFSIPKFATTERFFHVTCFAKGSLLLFFSLKHDIFIHQNITQF